MKKITRVALITSGGDCQGLNAAMRGIGKALHNKVENLEIFGMYDGYRGLVDGDYKFMEPKAYSLRAEPFSAPRASAISRERTSLTKTETA